MKNKNLPAGRHGKRVNLFFVFSILLLAGFFGFKTKAETAADLIISEILVGGEKAAEEFIEIYNPTENSIDLEALPLKLHTINSSGTTDTNKTLTFNNKTVPANGYFVISSKEYAEKFSAIVDAFYGSGVLAKDWSVYISQSSTKDTTVLDMLKWEECEKNYSYSFNGAAWECTSLLTPGTENKFAAAGEDAPPADDEPDDADTPPADTADTPSSRKVYLNEILPNPKSTDKGKEFIEIYNAEDSPVDLSDWKLQYSAKKYPLSDIGEISPGKYLILYDHANFSFSLGNSGARTLSLLDKDGKKASTVTWNGAKENVSYNFDGALWHWSKKLTPGEENKFNQAPKIKIATIKNAYVGVPVSFSASAKDKDKDKLKYTWDFGDKHKSYLKNPTHIFAKKKNYHVVLTVDDGSEKFAKTLKLEVKNYPKTDVKIVQLSPNPTGNDTGQEKISLLNNSKKKINLKGWKIATGSKKVLVNHPIAKDFFVEPGKVANLTKQNAAFYLTNTAMQLELRYPNGKTADKVAYAKEKIADNEIYKKTNGQWAWIAPATENKLAVAEKPAENNPIVVADETEIQNNLGKFSANPETQKKKANQIILASHNHKFNVPTPQGRVLGAATSKPTVAEIENQYLFAPYTPKKHWAVKLIYYILTSFNSFLNKLALNLNE
ncbi:MAG: lamin tail domain-containing protein [Parcubacteria group bacterium]